MFISAMWFESGGKIESVWRTLPSYFFVHLHPTCGQHLSGTRINEFLKKISSFEICSYERTKFPAENRHKQLKELTLLEPLQLITALHAGVKRKKSWGKEEFQTCQPANTQGTWFSAARLSSLFCARNSRVLLPEYCTVGSCAAGVLDTRLPRDNQRPKPLARVAGLVGVGLSDVIRVASDARRANGLKSCVAAGAVSMPMLACLVSCDASCSTVTWPEMFTSWQNGHDRRWKCRVSQSLNTLARELTDIILTVNGNVCAPTVKRSSEISGNCNSNRTAKPMFTACYKAPFPPSFGRF